MHTCTRTHLCADTDAVHRRTHVNVNMGAHTKMRRDMHCFHEHACAHMQMQTCTHMHTHGGCRTEIPDVGEVETVRGRVGGQHYVSVPDSDERGQNAFEDDGTDRCHHGVQQVDGTEES
jgi:hypothetical protein